MTATPSRRRPATPAGTPVPAASGADPKRFVRDWAFWTKPRPMIAFILVWDVIALALLVYGVTTARAASGMDWARVGGLAACATLHIQLTRRQEERRRNRVSAVHIDLSGIWIFPAALVLPINLTLLLLITVRAQRWVNSRRPPHKFLFTSFTHAVSAFAAQQLFVGLGLDRLLESETGNAFETFGLLALIGLIYAAIQAVLIGSMLALGGTSNPTLSNVLGNKTDNLLELSTIGLGIITTVLLVALPPAIVILILISVVGNRLAEINQLQSEARTDPKTGVFNIRGWSESAERAISRAAKGEDGLAVLMIDLDHFKWINDTYGHPAGDDVLRNVAQTLDEVTRPNDIVGRFGGEEFLVLLPDIDKTATELAAERVRGAIEELRTVTTDKRGGRAGIANRTASVGVALLPWHGSTLDSLLQAADAAVYEAKENGRNQVRFAPAIRPDAPEPPR
jgi:diguanylate cyclase (GGDEF)-like protein